MNSELPGPAFRMHAPDPLDAGRPDSAARGDNDADALVRHARAWLPRAHSPYSQFAVAAIAVDEHGRHHAGVNVENASYGLTVCAERVAMFAAVTAGARRITALAVSAARMKPVTPCGACRQVLAEFGNADTPVYADAGDAPCARWTLGELLPAAFDGAALGPLPIESASSSGP